MPIGTRQPGYGVILTNQPGADSWPMTAATFILIHKQPQDPAAAAEALKFFAWAYAKGGKMAEELDYIPMPTNVVDSDQEDLGRARSRTPTASRSSRCRTRSRQQRERRRAGAFSVVRRPARR